VLKLFFSLCFFATHQNDKEGEGFIMKDIHQNIKVIVSDLDGTLLNSHYEITTETKAVFNELYQRGDTIIIAS
jgi:haloacid dehalogenase-like hydrolase